MKDINDIFFFVQARMGSTRIPGKMLRPFAGTTLMDIIVQKILRSKIIPKENFYLSVYEPELKEIGKKYGVNVFHRSYKSAYAEGVLTDIYEWHDKVDYKYAVKINGCSPFLSIDTIDEFVKRYVEMDGDGLFGVIKKNNYFWNKNHKLVTPWPEGYQFMNTKMVEETFEAAHCLYGGRTDLIKDGIWMGDFQKEGDIELFEMSEEEVLDIDYEWQFKLYEILYKGV